MKKRLLILLGISALALGSCSQENPETPEPTLPIAGERLKLSIEAPAYASETVSNTRVAPQTGENTINSLYLLFFEPTSNQSGRFLEYVRVPMPDPDEQNPEGTMGMNIDTEIDFSDTSLDAANAYNILAIANISDGIYVNGDVDGWIAQWNGKKESEVMAAARVILASGFSPSSLPMHGRMEKPAGENQAHLLLARDVARFDLFNRLKNDFDLLTVSVWNAYPSTSIWEQGIMDYSSQVTRVRRHYAFDNESNVSSEAPDATLNDIQGGLYAFENQVATPAADDKMATCLVVGLRRRSDGKIGYYRVNIIEDETGSQVLRRNYAYSLIITGVEDHDNAASTEETAYLGQNNTLIYTIGEWSVDPGGLIVQDEHSMLSIPTKTVNMGKKGQTYEFKIQAISDLPSPAPLAVRNQTYRPTTILDGDGNLVQGIDARLDGNTLIITSTDLELDETERHGMIVLSFAGLEISMNVMQSGVHDHFLQVTLPDGGISQFPAYSGISSGLIGVQASGTWTAKLYMEGFSFNASSTFEPVEELVSTDNLVIVEPTDNTIGKFRVHTHSYNTTDRARDAFIVVSLDGHEEQYSSVISLSQDYVKQLRVAYTNTDPNEEANRLLTAGATFNGTGTGLLEDLNNNYDEWYVITSQAGEPARWTPWTAVLVMSGSSDDTDKFEIIYDDPNTPQIDGTNVDPNDLTKNMVKVKALGMNTSGRDYTATLRVMVDPGSFTDITLIQKSASLKFSPEEILLSVPAYGGDTEWISVLTEPGTNWKATMSPFAVTSNIRVDRQNVTMQGHGKLTLKLRDENGHSVPFVEGREYPSTTQFALSFPTIYYPNRGIGLRGGVTITVGGLSQEITAEQLPLLPRRQNAASRGWAGPGFLDGPLVPSGSNPGLAYYRDNMLKQTVGYYMVKEGTAVNGPQTAISESLGVTYIHFTGNQLGNGNANAATVVASVKEGMDNMDARGGGMTFVVVDRTTDAAMVEAAIGRGYDIGSANSSAINLNPAVANTKIAQFLTTHAYWQGNGPWSADPSLTFNSSAGTTLAAYPESAVPLMTTAGGAVGMAVDPKNRIIYFGDSNYVDAAPAQGSKEEILAWSLRILAAKVAQYGRSFSDMLVEESQGGVPAPWDEEYWGENALTEIRTVNNTYIPDKGIGSDPNNDGLGTGWPK